MTLHFGPVGSSQFARLSDDAQKGRLDGDADQLDEALVPGKGDRNVLDRGPQARVHASRGTFPMQSTLKYSIVLDETPKSTDPNSPLCFPCFNEGWAQPGETTACTSWPVTANLAFREEIYTVQGPP